MKDEKEEYAEYKELIIPVLEDLTAFKMKHKELINKLIGISDSEIENTINNTLAYLDKLKEYAQCIHEPGPEEKVGNDSHCDYYEIKCIHCKKVLKDWSN